MLTPSLKANLGLPIPFIEIKLATNDFDEKFVVGYSRFKCIHKKALKDGTQCLSQSKLPRVLDQHYFLVLNLSPLSLSLMW